MDDSQIIRVPSAVEAIERDTQHLDFTLASERRTGTLLRTLAAIKPGIRSTAVLEESCRSPLYGLRYYFEAIGSRAEIRRRRFYEEGHADHCGGRYMGDSNVGPKSTKHPWNLAGSAE